VERWEKMRGWEEQEGEKVKATILHYDFSDDDDDDDDDVQ